MTNIYEEYNRRINTLLNHKPELLDKYTRDQIELIYDYYRGSVEEGHAIESLEDYIHYEGDRIMEEAGETVKEPA
jgi:hypothetical protein